LVAGTEEAIMMVEAKAKEVSEEQILEALEVGHEAIKEIVKVQKEMVESIGQEKMEVIEFEPDPQISSEVINYCESRFKEAIRVKEKLERESIVDEIKADTIQHFLEIYPDNKKDIKVTIDRLIKKCYVP
jgi:polyribonucleotide nucleotidyltransferase